MQFKKSVFTVLGISLLVLSAGCGKQSASDASEDDSASGAVASAVGASLSNSSSNGTQAVVFESASGAATTSAATAAICPTFKTTAGSTCSAAGSTLWLNYSACSFGGSASWNGTQALIASSGSAACGTFPNPGASGNLVRQFVASSGSTTPGKATVTTAAGVSVTLDHATANLGNFDDVAIATLANGGYGLKVGFSASGARNAITIAHRRAVEGVFDHSVSGQLTVSEDAGASSRTVSGTVKVYHNRARVIGTSVLTAVAHTDGCCMPTSGTIKTTFEAGTSRAPLIPRLVGRSETLTFTGCGTASLVNDEGTTVDVTLSRCF